jgi:PPOX class probable FMN-dependent enzyme
VRGDGRPACRTVVFRGFLGGPEDAEEASRLTFVTDARSEKVEELGRQPACELCWYLPGTREQFRISGRMEVVGARAATGEGAKRGRQRQGTWGRLSGKARQQFLWPPPGLPRGSDDSLFSPPEPEASSPAAEDFCLLVLTPDHVDHLSLKKNKRWTHSRAGGWEELSVNP